VPRSGTDFISKDHICHLVIALVDNLDMGQVEEKYRGTRGKPAYSRKMLLRFIINGLCGWYFLFSEDC
jgi:transposase